MTDGIDFQVADGKVAVVTLNRPTAGNAIDGASRDRLNAIWQEVRERKDIYSVVLTGVGERFFCTGLDLHWSLARSEETFSDPHWPDIKDLWKPVILAINGICSGGGFHFLYQSDFAIGSTNASFLEPHVSVGLVPVREAMGLATRMPFGAVARMTMMGKAERLSADDAYRLGLLTEVVSPNELMDRAIGVCRKINAQSPRAVRALKEILHKSKGLMYEQYHLVKWAEILREQVHAGPDPVEGQRAFRDKREPRWED